MKKYALITFVMLIVITIGMFLHHNANAQSPNWLWATGAGGADWDHAYCLTTDASGNVLAAGSFASPSLTFGSTTLTNNGSEDVFITKYDGNGNALWAKSAGGTSYDITWDIATDANGNVLVTGSFNNSPITFGSTTLTNAGGRDIFIAKYDAGGNVLWAISIGGTNDDEGSGIATDLNGNVFVTGYFKSYSITFGTTTLTNSSINSLNDIFMVKYDPSGNVLWAKGAGGTLVDQGSGISTDAGGNVLATGSFDSDSITFGSFNLTISTLGNTDVFTMKYDGSGNVLWAKGAGGGYSKGGFADVNGNFVLTGSFYSSFTFGATILTSAGNNDIFVAKYDSSGNELWAKGAGGTGYDYGYRIASDASGNVLATGSFSSPSITFGSTTLTNTGSVAIFIVKYDGSGNVIWAKGAGGTNIAVGYGISTDASGSVFEAGGFYNAPVPFGSTTLTNAGSYDVFIAKLSGTVGVNEINGEENVFSLSPNPSSANFTIAFSSAIKNGSVEIINVMGEKVLMEKIMNESKKEFHLINYVAGIYFVNVIDGEKSYCKKLIIE